jgi:hypothetical protein
MVVSTLRYFYLGILVVATIMLYYQFYRAGGGQPAQR